VITVLGKVKDTIEYIGKEGYNVLERNNNYSFVSNLLWLEEAILRGDKFLLVSLELTGTYKVEVEYLLETLAK